MPVPVDPRRLCSEAYNAGDVTTRLFHQHGCGRGGGTACTNRNYIKEFVLARNRELGKQYGVEYAEAFHYIGPGSNARGPRVEEYIKTNAVPLR